VPEALRPFVAPLIPAIVNAIHEALALGIASTFLVSIGAAILAAVLVLFLKDTPLVIVPQPEADAAA
jgi:uncharacterized membrane protein